MSTTVLGLFTQIENTAEMVRPLEEMSVLHKDISLISVAPYPEGTLFHDEDHSPMWAVALVCGIVGFFAAVVLAGWTQWHININVGGKPTWSVPPMVVICYEFTLAGAVLGTFFSMLWWARLPDWNELAYDREISKSKIGLLVRCENEEKAAKVEELMKQFKASSIKRGRDDF
ncbi:MAG: DUF3341 domain-containing protein [Nitrospinae bacterium]|nr:DUF3341 domain-containing protein [Nitrospinota bacterium]